MQDYLLMLHEKKIIVGYGASATSTTLISTFQLDNYISYLVDDNTEKVGTYSPGYHIPVYDSSKVFEEPPYIIIILAWRYEKRNHEKIRRHQK